MIAIASVLLLLCGAIFAIPLAVWAARCLTRAADRLQGIVILASGLFLAAGVVTVGFLTAPPSSPGLFRFQALIAIAGFFGLGATAGKVLYSLALLWKRGSIRK